MSELPAAFRLDGRVAVITGAASGIGRATARALADAGAKLVLGDRDEAGLKETQTSLSNSLCLATDVSDRASVEALVAVGKREFGRIDVLANVAGILDEGLVTATDEAKLDRLLAVNLKGVFFGCQAVVPLMTEQGSGSIVNVASSIVYRPMPGLSAYAMSKAGVISLTQSLALEVASAGVRVNAVAPGMVTTPMAGSLAVMRRGIDPDAALQGAVENARAENPLGIEGQPEDVAHSILFLASDAARYMTGQVLHPNGGIPMV